VILFKNITSWLSMLVLLKSYEVFFMEFQYGVHFASKESLTIEVWNKKNIYDVLFLNTWRYNCFYSGRIIIIFVTRIISRTIWSMNKDRHGAESYGSYINIYLCNMCSIMWISLSVICGWSMFFLNFLVLQLLRI
jgi:hypothetical protein